MLPSTVLPPEVPGPRSDAPDMPLGAFLKLLVFAATHGKQQSRPESPLVSPAKQRRRTKPAPTPDTVMRPPPTESLTDVLRRFSEHDEAATRELFVV